MTDYKIDGRTLRDPRNNRAAETDGKTIRDALNKRIGVLRQDRARRNRLAQIDEM